MKDFSKDCMEMTDALFLKFVRYVTFICDSYDHRYVHRQVPYYFYFFSRNIDILGHPDRILDA